ARIDLVGADGDAADSRGHRGHRTTTFTAGEYTRCPAHATRISAHHSPGSVHAGGATSNSSVADPPAGNVAPRAAGPIHSHVPHGLMRCASTARSAWASVPTVTA